MTTDVIVGFPQETEEDFHQTEEFVKKVQFAELHVFKYSKRDGTAAAKMTGQVDENVKAERSAALIQIGNLLKETYRNRQIGHTVKVLFEEEISLGDKKYFVGHTRDYIRVAVESPENIAGKIIGVRLMKNMDKEIMLATL